MLVEFVKRNSDFVIRRNPGQRVVPDAQLKGAVHGHNPQNQARK